jgi:imidazolonepropionase-like amidohydrolase
MKTVILLILLSCSISAWSAPQAAPDRVRGEGPFERLILRNVMLINGEGAPAVGPMDVLIENEVISEIRNLGILFPVPPDLQIPAREGDRVLELSGHYLLPGFIDLHAHFGGEEQGVPAEYAAKLWLAHGITTIREPGSGNGLQWVLQHQQRSASNAIAAPRIIAYVTFGQGEDAPFLDGEEVRRWVRSMAREGAQGIKFFGAPKHLMQAAFDEARAQGLGTAMHHAQLDVVNWNALDSARAGLTTMEHWYGLPEAMFEDRVIQDYPLARQAACGRRRRSRARRPGTACGTN